MKNILSETVKDIFSKKMTELLNNMVENPPVDEEEVEVDLSKMDRTAMKKFIAKNKLDVKVFKIDSDEDIRKKITDVQVGDEEEVEELDPVETSKPKIEPEKIDTTKMVSEIVEKAWEGIQSKIKADQIQKASPQELFKMVLGEAGIDSENFDIVLKDKKKGNVVELEAGSDLEKKLGDEEEITPSSLDKQLNELDPEDKHEALNYFLKSFLRQPLK